MSEKKNYRLSLWEAALIRAGKILVNADFKGSWRLQQLLARYVPSRDVICSTNYGFRLIVNPRMDPYQRVIFMEGTYEPGLLSFMGRVLRPGDVFLDVGANIGLMSLAASCYVGPTAGVYAFEPESSMFRRLLENIELNKVQNVTAVQTAVGAMNEIREVFAYPLVNIGRASLVKSQGAELAGQTSVITLASFVEERKLEGIRMIKIDVEGFEYEVLAGARACLSGEQAPILSVECDDEMPRDDSTTDMSKIHDLILGTENYEPYMFTRSKFYSDGKISPLAKIGDVQRHDNIIYIPGHIKNDLPPNLYS